MNRARFHRRASAGLPPRRQGEDPHDYLDRLLRPSGRSSRDALARGWADHVLGQQSQGDDWQRLADLVNPRQYLLHPPGEPVPLVLSAEGARCWYLVGLAGLDEPELSQEALEAAVYFLSATPPGRKIVQDLVPGYLPESQVPPANLAWLRRRGLWQGEQQVEQAPGEELRGPELQPEDLMEPAEAAAEQEEAKEEEPGPLGLVRPCSVCQRLPGGWHKCCPACRHTTADGEEDVERYFGFRTIRGRRTPQTWCRRCRSGQSSPPEQQELPV